MNPDQIRVAIETARDIPREALRAAARNSDALLPAVLDVLDRAKRGVHLLPAQENLLFYGVPAMAAARRSEIYRPFLAVLQERHGYVAWLLGDVLDEALPRVVLSAFDGDPAPLIAAIEDRASDGFARWGLLEALAQLAIDGAIAPELAMATLERFERDRLAADGDAAWEGWVDAALRLAPGAFAERIRATWADGRNPTLENDQAEVEMRLQPGASFDDQAVSPVDDPAALIEQVGEAPPHWRVQASDETGAERGSPDAGALSVAETDWLSGFLLSSHVAEMGMTLEALDGFFVGLLVGPEPVVRDEHMSMVWGGATGPAYDSPQQEQFVRSLLARHWTSIAIRLDARRLYLPLIETKECWAGAAWAVGFSRAVLARKSAWTPLFADEKAVELIEVIANLLPPGEGEETEALSDEERQKLIVLLPSVILPLHVYWRRSAGPRTARRSARKVGRNEPCPCGSGIKFKRCCGSANATLH